ncbi:hypothetical protein V3C99_007534, partial [Haemonchus contortus]
TNGQSLVRQYSICSSTLYVLFSCSTSSQLKQQPPK